jgi:hypothetical protein
MPLRNRVTPLGELVATPERGLVYGNRGRLHDEHGEIRRTWQVNRWISCRLEFRGRRREGGPLPRGRYTGLFFLDEATALAAGHRPCAECRNADYRSFLGLTGAAGADELDGRLHVERLGDDVAGPPPRAAVRGAARRRVRPARRRAVARPWGFAPALDGGRLHRTTAEAARARRGRDHAADFTCRARRRLGRKRAAPSSVERLDRVRPRRRDHRADDPEQREDEPEDEHHPVTLTQARDPEHDEQNKPQDCEPTTDAPPHSATSLTIAMA